jgi:ABC-type amino acid transport substrate-binding protein
LFTTAALAASNADSLVTVKKEGKLKIAIDATYPPMEFEGKDGKPTGFDVEFAKELAKRVGVNAEFVVMNWDGILAGLQSGRYDVIISSMNITPDREKQADFVEYLKMSQVFVSRKGKEVKGASELAGKVVAVQADTTSHSAVQAMQKKGIAMKEIKAFPGALEVFAAVKTGQADVVVTDEPVGRYYAKNDAATFVVTGEAMAAEPVGIAMRKGDKNLKAALEKATQDMKKDGTFKKISENWFGTELGQSMKSH